MKTCRKQAVASSHHDAGVRCRPERLILEPFWTGGFPDFAKTCVSDSWLTKRRKPPSESKWAIFNPAQKTPSRGYDEPPLIAAPRQPARLGFSSGRRQNRSPMRTMRTKNDRQRDSDWKIPLAVESRRRSPGNQTCDETDACNANIMRAWFPKGLGIGWEPCLWTGGGQCEPEALPALPACSQSSPSTDGSMPSASFRKAEFRHDACGDYQDGDNQQQPTRSGEREVRQNDLPNAIARIDMRFRLVRIHV